jgi:hypothetical protein
MKYADGFVFAGATLIKAGRIKGPVLLLHNTQALYNRASR